MIFPGKEEVEDQLLDLSVVGLGRIEVGADAVSAVERSGGHVGAGEDVLLLDLGIVEEDGEALAVEDGDDFRVPRQEGTWRRVDSDYGGAVEIHAGLEELGLVAEVLETILDGGEEGDAVAPWDGLQRQRPGFLLGILRVRQRRHFFSLSLPRSPLFIGKSISASVSDAVLDVICVRKLHVIHVR